MKKFLTSVGDFFAYVPVSVYNWVVIEPSGSQVKTHLGRQEVQTQETPGGLVIALKTKGLEVETLDAAKCVTVPLSQDEDVRGFFVAGVQAGVNLMSIEANALTQQQFRADQRALRTIRKAKEAAERAEQKAQAEAAGNVPVGAVPQAA